MKNNKLSQLIETDLQYLYNSEKQLVKSLVNLSKIAADPEFRKTIEGLAEKTKRHIQDLESVFEDFKFKCRGKKSKGMEGILEEAQEITLKTKRLEANIIDAALIATIQRALNYNITTYKLLKNYSSLLGNQYVAELLDSCLGDDVKIDKKLLRIATRRVNPSLNK